MLYYSGIIIINTESEVMIDEKKGDFCYTIKRSEIAD